MYFQAIYADKIRLRSPIIMANACFGLIGLPLLGFAKNNGVRYFGVRSPVCQPWEEGANTGSQVFLAALMCNCNVPAILTVSTPASSICTILRPCQANTPQWQANNVRGQWKRALCSATLIGGGGIGGIIGSTVFRTQDRPGYVPGIIATTLACGVVLVVTALLDLKFWLANKRVDKGGKMIEGLEGFHYTL